MYLCPEQRTTETAMRIAAMATDVRVTSPSKAMTGAMAIGAAEPIVASMTAAAAKTDAADS